jgi:hypothetical protein
MYRGSIGGAIVSMFLLCTIGMAITGSTGSDGSETIFAASNIIAHWELDEGTGTIAHDSSGNGNDGMIDGPSWVQGLQRSALLFNSVDDRLTVPDDDVLDIQGAISIEVWFKGSSYTGNGRTDGNILVCKFGSAPEGQYAIATYMGGGIRFWLAGDGIHSVLDIPAILTADKWHYVVGTWDTSFMSLYLDGDLQASLPTPFQSLRSTEFPDDDLTIGHHSMSGVQWPFDGTIDNVTIWDVCLGMEQIEENYEKGFPVLLNEVVEKWTIDEDTEFCLNYTNQGWSTDPVWDFQSDSEWLGFDPVHHSVIGRPDNGDIGVTTARVTISDEGYSDSSDIEITVNNVPPVIIGEDILYVEEDVHYYVDYNCTEDGEPRIKWVCSKTADWLNFDHDTAVLNGTPDNDDVGIFDVMVKCDDLNGGIDSHSFTVKVTNVNDPPAILTADITTVDQDSEYRNVYEAVDIDKADTFRWSLSTNATWLTLNENVLAGVPDCYEIGRYFVNISVEDENQGHDFHNFTLTVNNINDPPWFVRIPLSATVDAWTEFSDHAEAYDPDPGDVLTFSIRSYPRSDIDIDPSTGTITWMANMDIFSSEPYVLTVSINVTDGDFSADARFRITVVEPPVVLSEAELMNPEDGSKIKSAGSYLEWRGTSGEGGSLTYKVYMHQTLAYVIDRRDETVYLHDYSMTAIDLTNVEQGYFYYWTVIPFENDVPGTCKNGIHSFYVNTPPTYVDPVVPRVFVGHEFKLKVQGIDVDPMDHLNLSYSLVKKPDGMIIDNSTGSIIWVPAKERIGTNDVEVYISDGLEGVPCRFSVEVVQADEEESKDHSFLWIILIIASFIVMISVGADTAFFILRRKRYVENVIPVPTMVEPEPVVMTGAIQTDAIGVTYIRPTEAAPPQVITQNMPQSGLEQPGNGIKGGP